MKTFESCPATELRTELQSRRLETSGIKSVLVKRLRDRSEKAKEDHPPVSRVLRRVISVEGSLCMNGVRDHNTVQIQVPSLESNYGGYSIFENAESASVNYNKDIINFPGGWGAAYQAFNSHTLDFSSIKTIAFEDISFSDFVIHPDRFTSFRCLTRLFKAMTHLEEIIVWEDNRRATHNEIYGNFSKSYRGYSISELNAQYHLSEEPVMWMATYYAYEVYSSMRSGPGSLGENLGDSFAAQIEAAKTKTLHQHVQVYYADLADDEFV